MNDTQEEVSQIKKPAIIFDETNKTVTLVCTDDLWALLLEWRGKENKIDFLKVGKLYYQLKSLFEKGK